MCVQVRLASVVVPVLEGSGNDPAGADLPAPRNHVRGCAFEHRYSVSDRVAERQA
jgi:hypothetical protein